MLDCVDCNGEWQMLLAVDAGVIQQAISDCRVGIGSGYRRTVHAILWVWCDAGWGRMNATGRIG